MVHLVYPAGRRRHGGGRLSSAAIFAQEPGQALTWSEMFDREAQKGVTLPGLREVYPVLELTLPGGLVRRYASAGVASRARGLCEPRVIDWGSIGSGVSERDNRAGTVECDVTIADPDRAFAKQVAAHRGTLQGSPAVISLLSPNVADADSAVRLTGILDSFSKDERTWNWKLRIRNDDRKVRLGELLKALINATDWPNADPSAVAQFYPLIYGTHDSTTITGKGAVKTLYVDKVGFRYLVSLGAIPVDRVYVSGTLTGAGFAITNVTVNGKSCTLIDFTTDQGAAVVTADVRGFTDKPDGTGTVIQNQALQLLHLLANFGFSDWRSGAYVDPSAVPLDVASFYEVAQLLGAIATTGGGSKRFAGSESPAVSAVIDEWLDDHDIKAFWTHDGKLAIRALDYRPKENLYLDRPWIQGDEQALSVSHDFDTKALMRRVALQFAFLDADGKYEVSAVVADFSVADKISTSRSLTWSRATVLSHVGLSQNIASRMLRLRRRPIPTVTIRGPLPFAGVRLLDDVVLTAITGPTTGGSGWGMKRWERRRLRVLSSELDPKSLEVTLRCVDVLEYLANVWDTSLSEERSGNFFDGSARLFPSESFVYVRATKAWVESPATAAQGSKQIIERLAGHQKSVQTGQLIEGERLNWLTRCCWISGLTGWALTGTAVNGSAVAADTAELLFDSAITPQTMKWTAGSPHTADLMAEAPGIATQQAGTTGCVSIYHKDDPGAVFCWRLQRLFDNKYWDDTGATWSVAVVNNALPVRTSWERDASKPIPFGADATSLKLFLLQPTGGTAGRRNWEAHAQVEEGRYPTTPIVTDANGVVRNADDHRYENFHQRRVWPIEHGHAAIEVVPEWNASDVLSGDSRTFLEAYHSADDFDRLTYESAQAGLVFLRRVKGVEYRAVKAWTPARGTAAKLACRWVGPESEQNLAPYTLSVFVDGVKGTDVVAAGIASSPAAASYLRVLAGGFTRAGLKLWLKADSLALNDGDAVGTWADQSGNGNDATQGTAANKPTFKTGLLNGWPIVRFDGTNDSLNLPNFCSAFAEGEIFVVVKLAQVPTAVGKDGLYSFGTDALGDVYSFSGDNAIYDGFGSTARKSTGVPGPSLTAWRVYSVATRKGDWTSRLDGAQHFNTATNVVGFRTAPALGVALQTGANFLNGDMAEVLMFDHVLTPEERGGVLGALSDKYALGIGAPGCLGNAAYRNLDVRPFVPSDAEMADRP